MSDYGTAELWDRPPAAVGASLLDILDFDPNSAEAERYVDETGRLVLRCPAASRAIAVADLLGCVRTTGGPIGDLDWLVMELTVPDTDAEPAVIEAVPMSEVLAGIPIVETVTGGEARYLYGASLLLSEWVALIEENCAREGYPWILAGDVVTDPVVELPAEVRSALKLIRDIEAGVWSGSRQEFSFRPVGRTEYRIDFSPQTGSGFAPIMLSVDRQLSGLEERRGGDHLTTDVTVLGLTAEGDIEPQKMGRGTWRVVSVEAGTVTVEDPAGGDGPILVDGQFAEPGAEAALLRQDGTLEPIVGSGEPGTFLVADESGFALNDDIEIRADTDGTLLTSVRDPNATGRRWRTWPDETLRGERNHVPNPAGARGTFDHDAISGRIVSVTQDGDDLDVELKELPADAAGTVNVGDLWVIWTSGAGGAVSRTGIVSAGGTPDGSGDLSITIADLIISASGPFLNDEVLIYRAGTMPDGWSTLGINPWQPAIVKVSRDASPLTLTGTADGAQTLQRRIVITGITPDATWAAGHIFRVGGVSHSIASVGGVDGSGDGTVELFTRITVAAGAGVEILAPDTYGEIGAGAGFVMPRWKGEGAGAPELLSPLYTIRADPVENRLWMAVAATYLGTGTVTPWVGIGAPFERTPIRIRLVDDGGTELVSLTDADETGTGRVLDASGVTPIDLRAMYSLTTTRRLRIGITGVFDQDPNFWRPGAPFVVVREVMLFLGHAAAGAEGVPYIDGSHATRGHQQANRVLRTYGPGGGVITSSRGMDLASFASHVVSDEQITLGSDAYLYRTRSGQTRTARILGVRWRPGRVMEPVDLMFGARDPELSRTLGGGAETLSIAGGLSLAGSPTPPPPPPETIPVQPSGLTATAITHTRLDLTWTDNSDDETGFRVYRSLTSGTGFALVADVPSSPYSDTTVAALTEYFYRVTSYNVIGESAPSGEASDTTPDVPSGLTNLTPPAMRPWLGPIVAQQDVEFPVTNAYNTYATKEDAAWDDWLADDDVIRAHHYDALVSRLQWALINGLSYGPSATALTEFYGRGRSIIQNYFTDYATPANYNTPPQNATGTVGEGLMLLLEGTPESLTHIRTVARANVSDPFGYLSIQNPDSDARIPSVAIRAHALCHLHGITGTVGGGWSSWKAAGEFVISRATLGVEVDGTIPSPSHLGFEAFLFNEILAQQLLLWFGFIEPDPAYYDLAKLIVDHLVQEWVDRGEPACLPYTSNTTSLNADLAAFHIYAPMVLRQEEGDTAGVGGVTYREFALAHLDAARQASIADVKQFNQIYSGLGMFNFEALDDGVSWKG